MKESRPEKVRGTVKRQSVRRGTASEHVARILETADGDCLILQRIGGNPFEDAETDALVGHEVIVEGHRLRDTLRYTKATKTRS